MATIKSSIPQNIKKYRLLNNMTQEQLAEILNLDAQYYSQLERGNRNFSIDKIVNICSTFQIGIEQIIEIELSSNEDISELLSSITIQLGALNYKQLFLVKKYIDLIIPLISS